MRPLLDEIAARLERLKDNGLYRTLKDAEGIDFSSNDYLGLSRHPLVRERLRRAIEHDAISSPASRLLRGHLPAHSALEDRLAQFKGTESALLFSSGYQANIGVLTSLIGRDDRAISDAANHASIIDGLRLSRCQRIVVPHLDVSAIEDALSRRGHGGRTFLVTESLFSMDGDAAPLGDYADLAERYGASLIVDDAHAVGVYGRERGSGLCEELGVSERVAAVVSTFGKALGLSGAFVAGSSAVVDYLTNTARPFVFSTAVPPLLLAAVGAALDVVANEPARRQRVLDLAGRLRAALRSEGLECLRSVGPIVPVLIGENDRAVRIAADVRSHGYDVRAVRPPSVPPGTARLRLSVHADHSDEEISGLIEQLLAAVKRDPAAGELLAGPASGR